LYSPEGRPLVPTWDLHSPEGEPLVPTWDGDSPEGDYSVPTWDDYHLFRHSPCLLVAGKATIRALSEQRFAPEIGACLLFVILFVKVFTFDFAPNTSIVHTCSEIILSILLA
jgi:hypothetical protein